MSDQHTNGVKFPEVITEQHVAEENYETLGSILKKAMDDINNNRFTYEPKPKMPVLSKDTPKQGKSAHDNIRHYGKTFASWVREIGNKAVDDAAAYKQHCDEFADTIEQQAEEEANRSVRFTESIQKMGDAIFTASKERLY